MSNKHLSQQLLKSLDEIKELNKQIDALKNENKKLSDEIRNSKFEVKRSIEMRKMEEVNVTTTEQEKISHPNEDLQLENEHLRKQINLLQTELNGARQELNVCGIFFYFKIFFYYLI